VKSFRCSLCCLICRRYNHLIGKITAAVPVSLCWWPNHKELHEKVKQGLVQVRTERAERDLILETRTYDSISWLQACYCPFYLMRQKLCCGYFALSWTNLVEVVKLKHVRASCVRTPTVWAWTQKPRWNYLGSCWCLQRTRRFGQRELSLPYAWKSFLSSVACLVFPISLLRPTLFACSSRAGVTATKRFLWYCYSFVPQKTSELQIINLKIFSEIWIKSCVALYFCLSAFAWFARLHTLGTLVPQFAYWFIGSFLHESLSQLILYLRPELSSQKKPYPITQQPKTSHTANTEWIPHYNLSESSM